MTLQIHSKEWGGGGGRGDDHIHVPRFSHEHTHEQSCQPVTFKKSIIELKKTYFEVKKSILRAERAS